MKKLVVLLLSVPLILGGCSKNPPSNYNTPQYKQVQPYDEEDEDEYTWFEDEILDLDDMDEWGHPKKKKIYTHVLKTDPRVVNKVPVGVPPKVPPAVPPKAESKTPVKVESKVPTKTSSKTK